jgi:hypothetical protein
MKWLYVVIACSLFGCDGSVKETESAGPDSLSVSSDTLTEAGSEHDDDASRRKVYSNARFREVTVQKVGENRYLIEGEAQIFEANFGWVVEDGHQELEKGFEMTDAGAPEWGRFSFTVEAEKVRPNSTLTLVLFESSAKDGSRQHELPISLALPVDPMP